MEKEEWKTPNTMWLDIKVDWIMMSTVKQGLKWEINEMELSYHESLSYHSTFCSEGC